MVNVYETYGMTETITHIAAKRINENYFTVLPHANISQDERGCLVIEASVGFKTSYRYKRFGEKCLMIFSLPGLADTTIW